MPKTEKQKKRGPSGSQRRRRSSELAKSKRVQRLTSYLMRFSDIQSTDVPVERWNYKDKDGKLKSITPAQHKRLKATLYDPELQTAIFKAYRTITPRERQRLHAYVVRKLGAKRVKEQYRPVFFALVKWLPKEYFDDLVNNVNPDGKLKSSPVQAPPDVHRAHLRLQAIKAAQMRGVDVSKETQLADEADLVSLFVPLLEGAGIWATMPYSFLKSFVDFFLQLLITISVIFAVALVGTFWIDILRKFANAFQDVNLWVNEKKTLHHLRRFFNKCMFVTRGRPSVLLLRPGGPSDHFVTVDEVYNKYTEWNNDYTAASKQELRGYIEDHVPYCGTATHNSQYAKNRSHAATVAGSAAYPKASSDDGVGWSNLMIRPC